jgi:hypothetical protein
MRKPTFGGDLLSKLFGCHNRENLYLNMQESKQYHSHGGDCVEVCINESAGADINYKIMRKLRASLIFITALCAYKYSEEIT